MKNKKNNTRTSHKQEKIYEPEIISNNQNNPERIKEKPEKIREKTKTKS